MFSPLTQTGLHNRLVQRWSRWSLPVLVSNKRAFNERGCVFDLIIALIFLMAVPPFALLCRTVEPQHQHHQSQQEQGHGETQQHPLQDARRIIWSYMFTEKKRKKCHLLTPVSFQTCSTERLTCVDRQVNVAVLGSQWVGHWAAVEARGLRRHIGNVHRARRVTCDRYRYEKLFLYAWCVLYLCDKAFFLPSMFTGSVILSGSSFSQITCGVGRPSATRQDSCTLPPASVSPSHRHTGRDGGAAHTQRKKSWNLNAYKKKELKVLCEV